MKIKKITPSGTETVYNMTVEKHHNYLISGGIILKNCDALRYYCQSRFLAPEIQSQYQYDDDDEETVMDYQTAMCGGSASASYITY